MCAVVLADPFDTEWVRAQVYNVGDSDAIQDIQYIRRGMAELKVRGVSPAASSIVYSEMTDLGLGIRPDPRVHLQDPAPVPMGRRRKLSPAVRRAFLTHDTGSQVPLKAWHYLVVFFDTVRRYGRVGEGVSRTFVRRIGGSAVWFR